MNGMRAKARRNVVVTFCAQALTPTLSQTEREPLERVSENLLDSERQKKS